MVGVGICWNGLRWAKFGQHAGRIKLRKAIKTFWAKMTMFFPSTVFHSVQFGGQFALRMRCILAVYHNLGYVALNFKCAYQCDGLQALGYVAQETARLDQSKHLATWSWFGAIHLAGVHFPVPGATEYQQSVWTSETARAWKLAGASSRLFLV